MEKMDAYRMDYDRSIHFLEKMDAYRMDYDRSIDIVQGQSSVDSEKGKSLCNAFFDRKKILVL